MQTPNRNEYNRLPPWAQTALTVACGQQSVRRGIARCRDEEGVLILQFIYRSSRQRATVVQYPTAGLQAAYDKLRGEFPPRDHIAYFLIASGPALAVADRDGVPYMPTLSPGAAPSTGAILRAPAGLWTEEQPDA